MVWEEKGLHTREQLRESVLFYLHEKARITFSFLQEKKFQNDDAEYYGFPARPIRPLMHKRNLSLIRFDPFLQNFVAGGVNVKYVFDNSSVYTPTTLPYLIFH